MGKGCLFCFPDRFSLNKDLHLPAQESILWEDENIYVVPDLFPLVVGHMLVISKNHYNSFANAPISTINCVKSALQYLLNHVFCGQNVAIFEHGSITENSAGASISHAHLHVVPINFDLKEEINKSPLITCPPQSWALDDLHVLSIKRQPYIFFQSNFESSIIYKVDNLPSQFLRKIIADKLGNRYDWKKGMGGQVFIKRFLETIKKYGEYYETVN